MQHSSNNMIMIVLTLLLSLSIISCKKDVAPDVSNIEVIKATPYTLIVSALITSEGTSAISEEGFCVNFPSNNKQPLYNDCDTNYSVIISKNRFITDTITGLFPDCKYKICAYAINSSGIAYSETIIASTEK